MTLHADARLGDFESCPVALTVKHRDFVEQAFADYALAKRFSLAPQVDPRFLMTIDNEIAAIEESEARHRQAVEAARRKMARR